MMNKKLIILCTGIILAGSGKLWALGTDLVGTNSAEFLKIGISARAAGMGEAFTAVGDDANAIYYNPAGLATLDKFELTGMHLQYFLDVNYETLSYIHPTKSGVFGINFIYLVKDNLERTEANPLGRFRRLGKFSFSDESLTVSYSRKINSSFNWGINIKGIRERIDTDTAWGAAFDCGVLRKGNFSYGAVIQNIGTPIKFDEEAFLPPMRLKFGVSYKLLGERLLLASDTDMEYAGRSSVNAGVEFDPFGIIVFRGGYRYISGGYRLNRLFGISGGIGIRFSDYQLDYGFVPSAFLGSTHRISLRIRWGK